MSNENSGTGKRTGGFRLRIPNLGEIIFFAIFLYMIANLISYATKTHYTFVEVEPGQIINSDTFTGIAIRNESVEKASGSGYISYYVNDSEKTAKNGSVCVIETKQGTEGSSPAAGSINLSSSDYSDIREQILRFNQNYSDSYYDEIGTLNHHVGNIVNRIVSSQHIASIGQKNKDSYQIMTAPDYGVVSCTIDGMESLTADQVTSDSFNTADYEKKQLSAGSQINKYDPVYKLIKGDTWQIVLDPDEEQLALFRERDNIGITFLRDNITTNAAISYLEKDDHTLVCLTLTNYMIRYCNERFLDINIIWEKHDGYKIPTSSITSKAYYMLPMDFVVTSEETGERGFFIQGPDGPEFVKPRLYTKIEESDQEQEEDASISDYYYIDSDSISSGTVVIKNDSEETYTISTQSELKGVYNINEGFADFYLIGKPYAYGDYSIIEKKPGLSLSLYDHIILDAESVYEGQVIY